MAKTLTDFAKDLGFEADDCMVFLPYGRFRGTRYGVAIKQSTRVYVERDEEIRLSRTFKWHDVYLAYQEQMECNRGLIETFHNGDPPDPRFVEEFFSVLLKMFPEEQRKPLLRKHVYRALEKLMKTEEPEKISGFAKEFASYLKTIKVDYSFDPDEDISDIDETPPLPLSRRWEPAVQKAYRSLFKEGDTDYTAEISEKTEIEPDLKSMRREIQEGCEALLRGGWIGALGFMKNITGVKPHKRTVKRAYEFLLLNGMGTIIKSIEEYTGIGPDDKMINRACKKIFQEARSEGDIFLALRKLENLKEAGIKPDRNSTEAGYRACFLGRWKNAAKSLRSRIWIEPEDPEIKKWMEEGN